METANKLITVDTRSKEFKSAYIKLICEGNSEATALKTLGVKWIDFFEVAADDPDFRKDIEEARKFRAEIWVDRIVRNIDNNSLLPKEAVPAAKLEFEMLKFLAGADNPDRYGGKGGSKVDVNIDLSQFQLIKPDEALKVLQDDPFRNPVKVDNIEVLPKDKK
jgi:hypothetical protein